jgi:hypothetical protein
VRASAQQTRWGLERRQPGAGQKRRD